MEYILIQDDDCHWYVIPADKQSEFNKWAELDPDDDTGKSWVVPDYAKRVDGYPSLVKFKEYRIG